MSIKEKWNVTFSEVCIRGVYRSVEKNDGNAERESLRWELIKENKKVRKKRKKTRSRPNKFFSFFLGHVLRMERVFFRVFFYS